MGKTLLRWPSATILTFCRIDGGHDGPAKDATEAALAAGKDVVTPIKPCLPIMVTPHASRKHKCRFGFEAAVAGGIQDKVPDRGFVGYDITVSWG